MTSAAHGRPCRTPNHSGLTPDHGHIYVSLYPSIPNPLQNIRTGPRAGRPDSPSSLHTTKPPPAQYALSPKGASPTLEANPRPRHMSCYRASTHPPPQPYGLAQCRATALTTQRAHAVEPISPTMPELNHWPRHHLASTCSWEWRASLAGNDRP